MTQVITLAGERLFAQKAQANEQLDIDTFIFANVAGQDPNAPIDREEGVPTADIVHQQAVQQAALLNENAVVYSSVLDSVTGPFEFNWVGLYSSANQTLVAISHIPTVSKTVTVPGASGNTLNRNFAIEYSGISELTGITVAPETWQLDFTARLSGMDELTRQLAADMNGKDWFIGDGFKVVPRATVNTFSVTPGVGYVSGLRIELLQEQVLILQSYPQFVYVDAWFDGTNESIWKAQTAFTVTNTEMDDYIDVNGKQHYVFKLAVVNAADDVTDLRSNSKQEHLKEILGEQIEVSRTVALQSTLKVKATAIAESSSIGEFYSYEKFNNEIWAISSDVTKNGGWVTDNTGDAFIELTLPFGVVIGDSIAEGHPALHGRLHTSSGLVDLDKPNEIGQLSYEIGSLTGVYWYNQGIGGQTTSQVLARWERDALGRTFDPGDGKGNTTLPGEPSFILVNVGINNISYGQGVEGAKSDLLKMAESCFQNGITAIFNTPPAYNTSDNDKQAQIQELRIWMLTELVKRGVRVFDAWDWSVKANTTQPNPNLIVDSVHPHKVGYKSMAREILERCQVPWFLQSLSVDSALSPDSKPTKYSTPTRYKVEVGTKRFFYDVDGQKESQTIPFVFNIENERSIKLSIKNTEVVTGAEWTGLSGAMWCFGCERRESSSFEVLSGVSAIIVNNGSGWEIFQHGDGYGIDSIITEAEYITIKLKKGCTNLSAQMMGIDVLLKSQVGFVPSMTDEWRVYVRDEDNVALAPGSVTGKYISITGK